MCKKKYDEYILRVNGQVINLNGHIDKKNFATMKRYYEKTKEKYSNSEEDVIIELCGSLDGEIGNAIYLKEFKSELNEDKDLLKSTDEVVAEVQFLLELLCRKEKYHGDMTGALNKKQDLLLHKIENIDLFQGSDGDKINEKLRIVNEMQEIRKKRRFNKDETSKIKILNSMIDINEITEKFLKVEIPINTENIKYIDENYEEKIIKEIKYNSEKQRINTMSQIKNKYHRIVDDAARKVLICYNYGYKVRNK